MQASASIQFQASTTALSRAACDKAYDAQVLRLARIQGTSISSSAHRNRHRVFQLKVFKTHTSSNFATSQEYVVEYRYSALLDLSVKLCKTCEAYMPKCTACGTLVDALRAGCAPSMLVRIFLPLSSQYHRLDKFVEKTLCHAQQYSIPNMAVCSGCEEVVTVLSNFLKEPYHASTGVM